jgi:hypothetical protein
MIPASRRASRLGYASLQAAQSSLEHASAPHGTRSFTSHRLWDFWPSVRHDAELTRLMESQREAVKAAEKLLGYALDTIPNAYAWREEVRRIDSLVKQEASPLQKLSGEASLAFLLKLFQAGRERDALEFSADFAQFAVLPFNFHRLSDLTFTESEKAKVDQFALRVVNTFTDTMPSCGNTFVDAPAASRVDMLNRFMARVADDALRSDLGLSPNEMLMLQGMPIRFRDGLPLGAGEFGIDFGDAPVLTLSRALVSDSADLWCRISEENSSSDVVLLKAAETIAHEMVHACQCSWLLEKPADMQEFMHHMGLVLSIGAQSALKSHRHQPSALSPHEMTAWYASMKVCDAFHRSSHIDRFMREAAGKLMDQPELAQRFAQVRGDEPRGFVTLDEAVSL